MRRCIPLLLVLAAQTLSGTAVAAGEAKPEASGQTDDEPVKDPATADLRADSTVGLNLGVFSTGILLPFKRGASLSLVLDPDWTLEAEYLSASYGYKVSHIEFGSFEERLLLLALRHYPGTNSFNLRYGLGERRYRLVIGDETLDKLVPGDVPLSAEVLEVSTWVLDLGLGNRWQFGNGITFGVDWFELFIPVRQRKAETPMLDLAADSDSRDSLETAVKVLKYTPTFELFKIQVGYAF